MITKKRVRYRDLQPPVAIGRIVLVLPVDHPSEDVSNKTWAYTSRVRAVLYESSNGPVFETENTIYLPAETDEFIPEASELEEKV